MKFFISTVLLALVVLTHTIPSPARLYMNPDAESILADENHGEYGPYFEGDIMLTEEEVEQRLSNKVAPTSNNNLWTGGKLYYTIEGEFSNDEKKTMRNGVELINSKLKNCVQVLPRTNQPNYVAIQNGSGCSSRFGMRGGKQPLILGKNCVYAGIVAHEIIHAFGFDHEQKRTDRDKFVKYYPDNLENKTYDAQFRKYKTGESETYKLDYDYASIMHYRANAFGRTENGKTLNTLEPVKKGVTIGQREKLSDLNVAMIKARYGCK